MPRCHNALAPQSAWDESEEQVNGTWQRSFKKILENMYRRVKEEVRQYTAGLLAAHEWGVIIMYKEAASASHKGRSREVDELEALEALEGTAPKRRRVE